jgi:hypothetical protein
MRMQRTIRDLCKKAEELCKKLAHHELANVPMYVVSQSRLTPDVGAVSVCHAFTSPSLDLHLREAIGRDWRGRGACVVVNDEGLRRDFPDSFETRFLGTIIHELAHILERPSPYRPRPDADAKKLHSESLQIAAVVSGPPTPNEIETPWYGHEARFIRIAVHLWHRSKTHHVILRPSELLTSEYYALSPARWYAIAIEAEARQMAGATFREICPRKSPDAFRRLWTKDVVNRYSRKVAKLVPSANRQEVKTVRWLFQTYVETDRSARSLVIGLNKRGVPAPNGGERDFSHIKNILKHPVYIGCLTCNNYSVRTAIIEEAVAEHFRTVWRSEAGEKALRKAFAKAAQQRERDRPNRLAELESRLTSLDRQIARGKENLLLVDAACKSA